MSKIVRERLREAMAARGRKPSELAVAAGYGKDLLRDFLATPPRQTGIGADKLARIAAELGVTMAWLGGEDADGAQRQAASSEPAREIPVFGTAAGSINGAIAMSNEAIDWLPRPPGLKGARDVYALYVVGNSMEPRWRPGDVIFVHPHRPVRRGDHVVIQMRKTGAAETQSWVKEFIRTASNGDAVTRQYNPEAEMTFVKASVSAVHRVLTTNELFGV